MPKRVCWKGYVRKPGTKKYTAGSCMKKSSGGISKKKGGKKKSGGRKKR